MSEYFIIEPEGDKIDISMEKSKKEQTSQKTVYIADILKYYQNKIVIPTDKELDYREMLSCIKDVKEQSNDLVPWTFLRFIDEEFIPIKLVEESELPDNPIKGEGISPDTLGAYCSCDEKEKPIILLCPNKILEATKNDTERAKLLCKIVLIHEFAHAFMDPTNWKSEKEFAPLQKNQCQKITSDADSFMEESLANMLTLQYFNEMANNEVDQVKEFIAKCQPPIYKFGITQLELIADWKEWRDYKANKNPDFWSYWAGLFTGKKIVKSKQ